MATANQQREVAEQQEAEYRRNNEFQKKLREGIAADVSFTLKQEAGILSTEAQAKIANAVSRHLCNRLTDMFNIGDE